MEELILEDDGELKAVATFGPGYVKVTEYEKASGEWHETWMYSIPHDHLAKINAKLAEKEAQR